MKTIFSLLIISFLFVLSSCNKEQVQVQKPVAATDVENATALTKTQILTAKAWRYQKLVINYNPKTKTGKVVYKRGAATNTFHLDNVKAFYKTAGGYDEIDSVGKHHPGTWIFKGPTQDSVQITYTGNPTPLVYAIQTLTPTNYNVIYRFGNTLRSAAFVRVPNGQ